MATAPLKGSLMIAGIFGFLISLFIIYSTVSTQWGILLMIFFAILFIASMISMTKSP